jgi:hypothetical protein
MMKNFIKRSIFIKTESNELSKLSTFNKHSNLDFFDSNLLVYKSLYLQFSFVGFNALILNLKNLHNTLHYIFLNKLPIYMFSKKFLKRELRSANVYFNKFTKKRKPPIVVVLDNFFSRKYYQRVQYLNLFLIKPLSTADDYTYSNYPIFLNLNSELNSFIYFQFIKYIFVKTAFTNNKNFLKNYIIFLNNIRSYAIL